MSPSPAGVLAPAFQLRPTFGFEYELGGGAAIFAGNQFNLRHQFRLSRGLGVEVHMPPTLLFLIYEVFEMLRRLHLSVTPLLS